ncbi:efflux RND transporter periplasmic adaptor subunit [Dasania sp. GY-MA-18]|uniref:Efflux RND transporter periplasmic adaptor subunit n=1 Tax=Dasania phycosphaerae TaxID=2950436 RepID=A0A9J6RHX9_9GAMM|nr:MULTISPECIES: HlyD family efflux transporter periplasmic adaptor subunit [Dasania]MCR8921444.1 efflux RND transporter periplasmic adaptor subunit [Dasania sp. GY-MA-18]MCZ0863872.1 efflux RND transporter periplasmic adaptor subunit [Dasania phycosphaerae]MCZ0867600.1 efflux RND transporter periplasmic adaptor subunit [Dasania phycosphaerae]
MNYLAWLDLQCRMLPKVQRAILAVTTEPSQELSIVASWPPQSSATEQLLSTATLAASRQAPVVNVMDQGGEASVMVLAKPLACTPPAVVVVELPAQHQQQQLLLQLLAWGESWLQLLAQQTPAAQAQTDTVAELSEQDYSVLSAACGAPQLQDSVEAAATSLAQLFGCERVAIGLQQGDDVLLQGLSHNTPFDVKTNMARALEELMAESLEHDQAIQAPLATGQTYPMHQHYAQLHNTHVCSIPMQLQEQRFGVLLLQCKATVFSAAELQRLAALASFLGALFQAKRQGERSLIARAGDAMRGTWGAAVSSYEGRGRYLVAAAIVALAVLLLGSGNYRVAAPAKLEGLIQRAVVAPIDGYVAKAHARAGETVSLGQIIAELDDNELKLEYRRLQNQHDEYQQQYRKELADRNLAQSQIVQAQMAQAAAELRLLEQQLKRTQLSVPFDGVIIEGDLSRSLGAPVSKGQVLFEIAPLNEYRLVLQVDERDVPHVQSGQRGRLYLNAYPDNAIAFEVKDVATVYQLDGALISYRTEARLLANDLFLRPGMQGLAKIEVGKRRYSWMLTHRLWDWLSLKLWAWLP